MSSMDEPRPNAPHLAGTGRQPTAGDLTAVPPHDVDAEAAVLGACMHQAAVIADGASSPRPALTPNLSGALGSRRPGRRERA